jgi:hypothetical protein
MLKCGRNKQTIELIQGNIRMDLKDVDWQGVDWLRIGISGGLL